MLPESIRKPLNRKETNKPNVLMNNFNLFFYLGFHSLDIHKSQDCSERGEQFYSSLPLPPVYRYSVNSPEITADSSRLYVASAGTRTESLW